MSVVGIDVKCLTSDQVVRCSDDGRKSIQPALTANTRLHSSTVFQHKCLAAELLLELYLGQRS